MYESSPEYFKQYQKNFKYYVSDTLPNLHDENFPNFCFGIHNCDKFCTINNKLHYHVLVDTENVAEITKKLNTKLYVVPCLYSCYKLLLSNTKDLFFFGPVFDKLEKSVTLNESLKLHPLSANIKKRLPHICFSQKQSVSTQTDAITHITLDRLLDVMNGPFAADFFKIIDVLLTGYGDINNDSDVRFIKFVFDKKS